MVFAYLSALCATAQQKWTALWLCLLVCRHPLLSCGVLVLLLYNVWGDTSTAEGFG